MDARLEPASKRHADLRAIAYHLPEKILSNADLAREFPEWSAEKISDKLGIEARHVVAPHETSGDLAYRACEKLLSGSEVPRDKIDFFILCTQSPDYILPTTACLLQKRLNLPKTCGAFDFNLGCSGYVYGLSIAKGLIESGQADNILLVTAESYSRFLSPTDRGNRTIFGDGAAATWISHSSEPRRAFGCFDFGTDGGGGEHLIVKRGGMRQPGFDVEDPYSYLHMDGPEILSFALREVPRSIKNVCAKAGLSIVDIEYFVLHQANRFMLEKLATKLGLTGEQLVSAFDHCGNTVSSTIPIALWELWSRRGDVQRPTEKILLSGFGVGYSWASCLLSMDGRFAVQLL